MHNPYFQKNQWKVYIYQNKTKQIPTKFTYLKDTEIYYCSRDVKKANQQHFSEKAEMQAFGRKVSLRNTQLGVKHVSQ